MRRTPKAADSAVVRRRTTAEVAARPQPCHPCYLVDVAEVAIPQKIGPYRIERELGRGGMGVVYRAVDTKLDRPVAIKAISIDKARA